MSDSNINAGINPVSATTTGSVVAAANISENVSAIGSVTPAQEMKVDPSGSKPDLHKSQDGTQENVGSNDVQEKNEESNVNSGIPLTDQAVLDYLKSKGMGNAVLELAKILNEKYKSKEGSPKQATGEKKETIEPNDVLSTDQAKESTESSNKSSQERLEEEESLNRAQRTLLWKSTGGSYGYDRDSAWPIVQWGIPDTGSTEISKEEDGLGMLEARAYVNAFVSLQLWVMSLPDSDGLQIIENPLKRARALLQNATDKNGRIEVNQVELMNNIVKEVNAKNLPTTKSKGDRVYNLPPSCKSELLTVTFALLVHTYCELLEHGMESTAHSVRDAFRPIYEPFYPIHYQDLYQCKTTDDMMRLNLRNSQHMEAIGAMKAILVQIASYQPRRDELDAQLNTQDESLDPKTKQTILTEVDRYDQKVKQLKQKHEKLSQRASAAFEKMQDLPFLRRARAVRWQITISTSTYALLSSFLSGRDESLLCMCTLLQTKCELHVEKRAPLPFAPACIFDDENLCVTSGENDGELETVSSFDLNRLNISWTSPAPRLLNEIHGSTLAFPKFHLKEEYNDEVEAAIDKERVEFNRALLVNGFRRLEAIERKREYEALPNPSSKRLKGSEIKKAADPFRPSILMATLCARISTPALRAKPKTSQRRPFDRLSSIWEESVIGMCCAKLCPPDGRRVAVGCEDSAIRIWSAVDGSLNRGDEPLQVLLGHKNGFPVFDLDWNRDGRTLLSCGGDGSVRLWDSMALGPFGEVTTIKKTKGETPAKLRNVDKNKKPKIPPPVSSKGPDMAVTGIRPESSFHSCGAALAVYRGHVTGSPVWGVSFSPAGYYFASCGADGTARLFTTDRPQPVRLFSGHTASNVNCVQWHPNSNYIITGSDDRTVRLWDIQTGRTVRLLNGCSAGINVVQISPGGRCAAGADYNGVVHLWDLGSGRKITELRPMVQTIEKKSRSNVSNSLKRSKAGTIHSMKFSACGSALATGGDDCCVRIWDVRYDSISEKPLITNPTISFPTRQTVLMDFYYTRRNLLVSVGKYVSAVTTS